MYVGDPCYYLVWYVLCSRLGVAVSRWVGHYHTFMIATKWYVVTYVLYLLCSSSFLSWCWLAYQQHTGAKNFLKLNLINSTLQRLLEAFSKNFSFILEIIKSSVKPKCDNWLSLDLQDLYIKWFLYAFVLMYVKRVDQRSISCHILI